VAFLEMMENAGSKGMNHIIRYENAGAVIIFTSSAKSYYSTLLMA